MRNESFPSPVQQSAHESVDPSLDPDDLDPHDLELLRRGDARGLESAYRLFGARVQRTCLAMLGNRADAEDAVQEVFLRVLERARQFTGSSRFSTWLYRIAVNHCLNRKEKEALRRAEPIDGDVVASTICPRESPSDLAGAREAREVVLDRLAHLSEEHRAILVLREIDGLAYQDIADVLDVPVGTVMSRLARARERWIALAPAARESAPSAETSRGGRR
jgi:RNA polymerase sigma-70 factor (ECF subfamily)